MIITTPVAATAPPPAAGEAAPLLHNDLIIASRQRAREPELPAATAALAVAATILPPLARYDVIELPGPPDPDRLALELARRGHRVFSLGAGTNDQANDQPPGSIAVAFTPPGTDHLANEAALLALLASVRREAAIAAAVLLPRDAAWADVAVRARERWGWRIAVETGSLSAAPRLERAAGIIITRGAPDEAMRLALPPSPDGPRRVDRAAGWAELDPAIRATFPLVSVIIVNYNTLAFTQLCLASVLANTEYPNYELILIDNGSTDGSAEALHGLGEHYSHVRVVRNQQNLGFGPGHNQGLAIARGEVVVMLNSDTLVPPGWLTRLTRHLADPRLGLVGPATNRTCNEAQVAAPYETYGDFVTFARNRAVTHDGQRHAIRMPMMFCVAGRREVFTEVGPLDERFETGMFEDEDYALRVKAAGYDTAWAADAYVHHAYHATIGKLLPSGDYLAIFKRNQERFEAKWGICWERHRLPPAAPATAAE